MCVSLCFCKVMRKSKHSTPLLLVSLVAQATLFLATCLHHGCSYMSDFPCQSVTPLTQLTMHSPVFFVFETIFLVFSILLLLPSHQIMPPSLCNRSVRKTRKPSDMLVVTERRGLITGLGKGGGGAVHRWEEGKKLN